MDKPETQGLNTVAMVTTLMALRQQLEHARTAHDPEAVKRFEEALRALEAVRAGGISGGLDE